MSFETDIREQRVIIRAWEDWKKHKRDTRVVAATEWMAERFPHRGWNGHLRPLHKAENRSVRHDETDEDLAMLEAYKKWDAERIRILNSSDFGMWISLNYPNLSEKEEWAFLKSVKIARTIIEFVDRSDSQYSGIGQIEDKP